MSGRQRREIRIGVVHPVAARLIVSRADEDGDWEIESIRSVDCEASVRSIGESMKDDDWEHLSKLANAAKDLS